MGLVSPYLPKGLKARVQIVPRASEDARTDLAGPLIRLHVRIYIYSGRVSHNLALSAFFPYFLSFVVITN